MFVENICFDFGAIDQSTFFHTAAGVLYCPQEPIHVWFSLEYQIMQFSMPGNFLRNMYSQNVILNWTQTIIFKEHPWMQQFCNKFLLLVGWIIGWVSVIFFFFAKLIGTMNLFAPKKYTTKQLNAFQVFMQTICPNLQMFSDSFSGNACKKNDPTGIPGRVNWTSYGNHTIKCIFPSKVSIGYENVLHATIRISEPASDHLQLQYQIKLVGVQNSSLVLDLQNLDFSSVPFNVSDFRKQVHERYSRKVHVHKGVERVTAGNWPFRPDGQPRHFFQFRSGMKTIPLKRKAYNPSVRKVSFVDNFWNISVPSPSRSFVLVSQN